MFLVAIQIQRLHELAANIQQPAAAMKGERR